MTNSFDQPGREPDPSVDDQQTTDGGTRPFSGVPARVIPRARRGRIIAALIGVVAVGLAAGVTIFLWLEAHSPFAEFTGGVKLLATARLDGRTVVIASNYYGTIRVSDLATGDPIGQPINGRDGPEVLALTTAQLDRRPVIVSSGGDGMLRVWDLATGTAIGQPFAGYHSRDLDITQLDGRTIVIGAGQTSVRVWDLATGALVHELSGTYGAAATAQLDGRTVIVSGADRRSVAQVWDLATGALIGQYDRIDGPKISVATTRLGGRPVVISDGLYVEDFRVWDLATGDHVSSPLIWPDGAGSTSSSGYRAVRAITTAQLDGQTVIITGGDDGMVRVWDLATSTPIGRPLDGHLGSSVGALATAQLDGRPVVIAGGINGTVRVWDLASVRP